MPTVTVGFRGPRGVGLPEGSEGQFVSFGPGGAPVAVPLPEGNLPAGTEGQLVGYGPGGTPVAVDAPSGGGYDDTALAARVTEVEADVVTAQSRADAAYSLAQQGGGTGAYDDTEVRGLISAVDSKADANAAAIAAFGPTAWADITDKPATFTPSAHVHAWGEITGKPTTFAPDAHTHAISEVTGLQAALDDKQPTTTFKTVNGTAITGTGDIVVPAGEDGQSVTITEVTTQTAFDEATPGPLEIVVRTA